MKTLQLSFFGLLFLFLASCGKDSFKNEYRVVTMSKACQGIAVKFLDENVMDQNGNLVPKTIELLDVPEEFSEKGVTFYIKFRYDEERALKAVVCPAMYDTYEIYVCTNARYRPV